MSTPSMVMGQGIRPFLLRHLKDIVGTGNLPQTKIEHVGFINLLQMQSKPNILRLNTSGGHKETAQIKYLQRFDENYAFTNEADVCEKALFDPYKETSVLLNSFRAIALHLDDEVVAAYENEASAYVNEGTPATQLMNEMVERIMTAANAIMSGVRTDLLTTLVNTGIGVNRATGNNASKTVNIPLNMTTNPLASGINEILTDYSINLGTGKPMTLGSPEGLFSKFMNQQYAKTANASNGVNTALEAAGVMHHVDQKITTSLGANDILVIEPNTVQIVEYLQYTGFKAGAKPGASVFGTMKLPFQTGQDVALVEFDYQLRYNDCPAVFVDGYYGNNITMQKGWTIILSKKCGLFQIPGDAYRGTDPMLGNNGVLRYTLTNV